MAITQEKQVFSLAIHRKAALVLHYLEVQGSHKIGASQGSSRVTTLDCMNHPDNIPSDLGGRIL